MGMLVACLQLTPIACFTIYSYALIAFASYALYIDFNVKDHICGSKYHIWKFTFLNLMLWIFAAVSYLAWRGGGEGARARATVLIASYFGFTVWGWAMYRDLDDQCFDVFDDQYHNIWINYWMFTITDTVQFLLYFAHEAYFGQYLKMDLTIMPGLEWAFGQELYPETDKQTKEDDTPLDPTLTKAYSDIMSTHNTLNKPASGQNYSNSSTGSLQYITPDSNSMSTH